MTRRQRLLRSLLQVSANVLVRVLVKVRVLRLIPITLLALVASTVHAEVKVTDAYVFAPLPGKSITVAYATLQNVGATPQQLLTVTVPDAAWAETIELHEHSHDAGMMRMRKLESLAVAAGVRQQLTPGGIHLMVFGVRQLAVGESLPIVLHWANGEQQSVLLDVRQR